MNIPKCDDCKKILEDVDKLIQVSEVIFFELGSQPKGARGLHFCNAVCLNSWAVKNQNTPRITVPGGQQKPTLVQP